MARSGNALRSGASTAQRNLHEERTRFTLRSDNHSLIEHCYVPTGPDARDAISCRCEHSHGERPREFARDWKSHGRENHSWSAIFVRRRSVSGRCLQATDGPDHSARNSDRSFVGHPYRATDPDSFIACTANHDGDCTNSGWNGLGEYGNEGVPPGRRSVLWKDQAW